MRYADEFQDWPEPAMATLVAPPTSTATNITLTSTIISYRYYLMAILPVLFGSTGPVWFRLIGSYSGVLKASWRLQCASLFLLPLALYNFTRLTPLQRRDALKTMLKVGIPVGSVMGAHFGFVSTSVNLTSFAHAVVCMNVSPLFFSASVALRYIIATATNMVRFQELKTTAVVEASEVLSASSASLSSSHHSPSASPSSSTFVEPIFTAFFHTSRSRPLTFLEVFGSGFSLIGVILLVAGESGAGGAGSTGGFDPAPTLLGDISGLLASLTMAVYLTGGAFRGVLPLYVWMFTLHFVAATATGLVFLAGGGSIALLFGWMQGGPLFGTLGAAFFPSLLGHTIVNYLTAGRLPAFTVSLFLMMQPVMGNLIAWALDLQGFPGALAIISIPLVMYGGFVATVGSSKPEARPLDVILCRRAK